ncbi:Phosphatase dcr2 [Hypoxylon texense]
MPARVIFANSTTHRPPHLPVAPPRPPTHPPPDPRGSRRPLAAVCSRLVRQLREQLLLWHGIESSSSSSSPPPRPLSPSFGLHRLPDSHLPYRVPVRVCSQGCAGGGEVALYVRQARGRGSPVRLDPEDDVFWALLEGEARYGVEARPALHVLPTADRCFSVAFVRLPVEDDSGSSSGQEEEDGGSSSLNRGRNGSRSGNVEEPPQNPVSNTEY